MIDNGNARNAVQEPLWSTLAVIYPLWLVPSLGLLEKYFGVVGVIVAAVASLVGILVLLAAACRTKIAPSTLWFVALGIVAVMAFLVIYPLANSGRFGPGSDRDEALNIALHALLDGRFPYAVDTYLGNPPTPMPGALLIALPFYLTGNAAYQNLFWGPAFILWCRRHFARSSVAWIAPALILLSSPAGLDDFVVGGDYLVNAIYVGMAVHFAIDTHRSREPRMQVLASVLLGIAISSRPIYAIVPIAVGASIFRERPLSELLRFLAVTGGVALALNLPFYLYDPARFPTAHLLNKLDGVPVAGFLKLALPGLAILLAGLGFTCAGRGIPPFGAIALSLGVTFYPPVLMLFVVAPFDSATLYMASFTLPVTVFGTIAALMRFEQATMWRVGGTKANK